MSKNTEIASRLEAFADLLDAKGVEYKPRAYRRAAENIRDYPGAIEDLAAEGANAVDDIDGVGDAIASKVVEYFETGSIEELDELRAEYPLDMSAITAIEGVGPNTAGSLYEALDIRTLEDLETAAEAGEIREISGFGAKTEQNILDNIDFAREASKRQLLGTARPYGESVVAFLENVSAVGSLELAGSLRRWRATIGDVDVLVGSDDSARVIDAFTDWPETDTVIESGETRASVRADGVRIDLRVVVPEEFGSALQYFTGSKEHNVAIRNVAIRRGLKMNEYGMFDVSDVPRASESRTEADEAEDDGDLRAGERIAGDTESSMYNALDMPQIPPEMRENRGEIAAAQNGTLPTLLDEGDISGDLHTHTEWSDGANTVAEHVEAAAAFGHDYLAITDHATGPGMVGGVGLEDDELREQIAEIHTIETDAPIEVFAGVEVNIDVEGALSAGDDVLASLDCVVASPHSGLDGDGTDRLVEAAKHPSVDIIGHPSGRLLNQRAGMDVDVDRLAAVAADHGTALEINANPARLDLWGGAVKTAIDAGATIAINTDTHSPPEFENVRYGVHTARRGWAESGDVLNTWDVEDVREFLAGTADGTTIS